MTNTFFITSTGTGIGKTLVTTSLCWQLRCKGKNVTALKPVISGYDANDLHSDSALILKSCGIAPTPAAMEAISPWRYAAPLAPNMATAKEGHPVDMDKLVRFCLSSDIKIVIPAQAGISLSAFSRVEAEIPACAGMTNETYRIIEGVGGVMSPLTDRHTVLDWMAALGWPVILTAGSYLGSISHTLTAIEVLRARGLTIRTLIVSESESSGVTLEDTLTALKSFLRETIPVVCLPRLAIKDELWKHLPDIDLHE